MNLFESDLGKLAVRAGAAAATGGTSEAGFTMADALQAGATILGAVGSIQQGQAQKAAGENQARVAAYQASLRAAQAKAMEQQAGQERAVAQRQAASRKREGALVSGRARAVAAASGAGALDPTIIDITAGLDEETAARINSALYAGEERARGLEYGATLERAGAQGDIYAGEAAKRAGRAAAGRSYLSAAGTVIGGAGRIYDRREARKTGKTIMEKAPGLSRYADDDEYYG